MSKIELDALEAFSIAVHEHGYGASGLDIVRILRKLHDDGWQLTRKPEQVTIGDWKLNEADSKAFIDAMLNPPEPNEALTRASEIYKQLTSTSISDPVITSVAMRDQELAGATVTWPPPGIVNLFSIVESLFDGTVQAKVILGILDLRYAMKESRPLVSARRPEEALRIWEDNNKELSTLKFDGIEFNYHVDPIPF